MIGLFLAMLELIRQGMVRFEQDTPFSEIYLFLKVDIPDDSPAFPEAAAQDQTQTSPETPAESVPVSENAESTQQIEPVPEPSAIIEDDDDEDDEENLADLDIDELAITDDKDKKDKPSP